MSKSALKRKMFTKPRKSEGKKRVPTSSEDEILMNQSHVTPLLPGARSRVCRRAGWGTVTSRRRAASAAAWSGAAGPSPSDRRWGPASSAPPPACSDGGTGRSEHTHTHTHTAAAGTRPLPHLLPRALTGGGGTVTTCCHTGTRLLQRLLSDGGTGLVRTHHCRHTGTMQCHLDAEKAL